MESRFRMATGRGPAWLLALAAIAGMGVRPALAQETRADSLEQRVARLEAMVDSLLDLVGRERAAPPAAAPVDELAALREAARAAAAAAAPATADTGTAARSRTGNLTLLNPEISVTGDFVGGFLSPGEGPTESSAIPREFELSFVSALDPYARTRIFLSKEEELPIAGLEDATASGSVGIPAQETSNSKKATCTGSGFRVRSGSRPASSGRNSGSTTAGIRTPSSRSSGRCPSRPFSETTD